MFMFTAKKDLSPAKIIYESKLVDLAILQFDDLNKDQALPICTKDSFLGESVFAIGDPYRLEGSISSGIVSSLSRNDGMYLQTDVAVNPGSSGGPLISTDRKCVVGIVTAKADGSGISFAIPSSDARKSKNSIFPKIQ